MNKLSIIGNLTRDPIARTVKIKDVDTKVCNFTVAVNSGYGKTQRTNYVRVTAWRGQAELCEKYLSKGKRVFISGEVGVSLYQTADRQPRAGLELAMQEIEFLSPNDKAEAPAATATATMPNYDVETGEVLSDEEPAFADGLPF